MITGSQIQLPASLYIPAPVWFNMNLELTVLIQRPHWPQQKTNLLPLCFRHSKLVVAQEEGPHGLADLWLDAPVVDEAQQLLLLIAL